MANLQSSYAKLLEQATDRQDNAPQGQREKHARLRRYIIHRLARRILDKCRTPRPHKGQNKGGK